MQIVTMLVYAWNRIEAYLPDGEVNLITKGLLPGRGYYIALSFG